jgi:SAM-dependent methyltransferase
MATEEEGGMLMSMHGFEVDNSALSRKVVRAVCDLAHRPLAGLRVLDLACAHGHYSFEMAKLGAEVLGIEGRESWLEQARRTKQETCLSNVEFVQDDVRNLSRETYGEFDIVLCLGILYHLDAPDLFDFLERVFEVCRDFVIIDTHFAATPAIVREWRGKRYWGETAFEHQVGATREEKLKNVGSSLDNEASFWLTQASLSNVLQHVGFTSVFDCRIPLAYLYAGKERELKIWGNRIMLAAIKGQPLNPHRGTGTPAALERDWPENLDGYRFEQYIVEQQARVDKTAGRLGRVRGLLKRGLDSIGGFLRGRLDLIKRSLREILGRVKKFLLNKSQD